MAVQVPYPYPDPITGQWDPFAMMRNLRVLSETQFAIVPATSGGTGFSVYAVGDTLYAATTTTLAKLAIGATGDILTVAAGIPSWAAPAKVRQAMLQTLQNGTVAAAATTYFGFGSPTGAVEVNAENVIPQPGTFRNLFLRTNGAQPAGGSLVVTVRKNGAGTTLTLTVAAGAAAGNFSNVANSFAVVAGDRISLEFVNNDAGAVSATLNSVAVSFDVN